MLDEPRFATCTAVHLGGGRTRCLRIERIAFDKALSNVSDLLGKFTSLVYCVCFTVVDVDLFSPSLSLFILADSLSLPLFTLTHSLRTLSLSKVMISAVIFGSQLQSPQ